MERTMVAYRVQRQICPEIASRISSDGLGLRSSSALAVIIMPGVQKPHCSPWRAMKPFSTGSSSPSRSRSSTVRTSWPPAMAASIVQDLTGSPSTQTTQVPQLLVSHPQVRLGEPELVAEKVDQEEAALDRLGHCLSVDRHRHLHAQVPYPWVRATERRRARLVNSSAKWRLCSALPRLSVVGLQLCAAIAPASA